MYYSFVTLLRLFLKNSLSAKSGEFGAMFINMHCYFSVSLEVPVHIFLSLSHHANHLHFKLRNISCQQESEFSEKYKLSLLTFVCKVK